MSFKDLVSSELSIIDDTELKFDSITWENMKKIFISSYKYFSYGVSIKRIRLNIKRICFLLKAYPSIDVRSLSEEESCEIDSLIRILEEKRFSSTIFLIKEDINGKEDINNSRSFLLFIIRLLNKLEPTRIFAHLFKSMVEIFSYLLCKNERKEYFDAYLFLINNLQYKNEYSDYIKDIRYYSFNEAFGVSLDIGRDYITKVEELYNSKYYPIFEKKWDYDYYPRENYCINFFDGNSSDFDWFFEPEEEPDKTYIDAFKVSLKYLLLTFGRGFDEPSEEIKLSWITKSKSFVDSKKTESLKKIYRRLGIPSSYITSYTFLVKDVPISPANVRTIAINDYYTRFSLKRLSYILTQVISKIPYHVRRDVDPKQWDSILNNVDCLYFESDIKKSGITFPSFLIEATADVFQELYNSDIHEYIRAFLNKTLIYKNKVYKGRTRGFGLGNSNELETLIHIAVANLTDLTFMICNDDICYNLGNVGVLTNVYQLILDNYKSLGFIMNYKKIYLGLNHRFCERYFIYNKKRNTFKLADKYQLIYHILSDIILSGSIGYSKMLFHSFFAKSGFYCQKLSLQIVVISKLLYGEEFVNDTFCPYRLGGWGYYEKTSTLDSDILCAALNINYLLDVNNLIISDDVNKINFDLEMLLNQEYDPPDMEYFNIYLNGGFAENLLKGDQLELSIKNKMLSIDGSLKLYRKIQRLQRRRKYILKKYFHPFFVPIDIETFISRFGTKGMSIVPLVDRGLLYIYKIQEDIPQTPSWGKRVFRTENFLDYEFIRSHNIDLDVAYDLKNGSYNTIFGYDVKKYDVIHFSGPLAEVFTKDQIYDLSIYYRASIDCSKSYLKYGILNTLKYKNWNCGVGLPKLNKKATLRYSYLLKKACELSLKTYAYSRIEVKKPIIRKRFKEYTLLMKYNPKDDLESYLLSKPKNIREFELFTETLNRLTPEDKKSYDEYYSIVDSDPEISDDSDFGFGESEQSYLPNDTVIIDVDDDNEFGSHSDYAEGDEDYFLDF